MTLVEGQDFNIRMVNLPLHVGGCTFLNDDGTFDIYLNQKISEKRQKEVLDHEFVHIKRDHFYRDDMTVFEMEKEADNVHYFYKEDA